MEKAFGSYCVSDYLLSDGFYLKNHYEKAQVLKLSFQSFCLTLQILKYNFVNLYIAIIQHDTVYFLLPMTSLKIKDDINLKDTFGPCRRVSTLLQEGYGNYCIIWVLLYSYFFP